MPWDVSRRIFLKGAGLAAVGVGAAPSSLLERTARAAGPGDSVLVTVFLRGGADGLNLCTPYGETAYYSIRDDIALPAPGGEGGVLDLDGYFGLHPSLAPLLPLYRDGRLGFLHAVGNYGLTRSHFDAQDFMETGTPGVKSTLNGWLERTIARIPGASITEAVAFSSQRPRSFLGGEPVLVAQDLASFDLQAPGWRSEAESLLRGMYSGTTPLAAAGREAFDAVGALVATPELAAGPDNGAVYPEARVGSSLRQAARLVKAGLGTRCMFVDVRGEFDSHANQLQANRDDYEPLGQALAAFAQDLGPELDRVLLMVVTEFGRAAFENGSAGTDHGSAHCMIYLGGGVRGAKVHGRWPGLGTAQLYQERDLAVTTDFRDAFAEAARVQLGVADGTALFPGYTPGAGPGVV